MVNLKIYEREEKNVDERGGGGSYVRKVESEIKLEKI
jgi:hypothetical protein